jgi:rRNA maturation protein Nop10
MKRIRKCHACGQYTMAEEHCGMKSTVAHPPPYNPNDPYAKYRRMEKYGKGGGGHD